MFSLSCSWNDKLAGNAKGMVRQIKRLGINSIELSFALTKDFVCDIISMRDAGKIEVTSVHNFCPIPEGLQPAKAGPDYYSLASTDEEERRKALDATKETLLTARRLKAKVAIIHFGKVGISDKTKKLAGVLSNKAEYEKLKREMIGERLANQKPYFDKAMSSLEELSGFAKDAGVVIGIETRYYHNEIPSLDEIGIMLNRFKGEESIGYWHDTGHAQLLENLGLARHLDFLERYHNRMIGVHLHDITGIDDHLAPLEGDLDFSILKPYLKKDTILVLEPHQPATQVQIIKGIRYLKNLFGGR